MELRLVSTKREREVFAQGLREARGLKGHGFREKTSSLLGRVHLAFKELYGVYDDEGPEPDKMIGGFAIHNLAQFGPSCSRPDLSHLPPETVFEVGELWSLTQSRGLSISAARTLMTARAGCVTIPLLKGARALLIYAITRHSDMTKFYPEFEAAGPPLVYPFLETLDGRPVYVQPMVLQGEALMEIAARAEAWGIEANQDYSRVKIRNPFGLVHVDMRHAQKRAEIRANHLRSAQEFTIAAFPSSISSQPSDLAQAAL